MAMELEGDWRRDGYVVARGVFDDATVQKLRVIAERCLVQHVACNPEDGVPRSPEETLNHTCMRHLNHPGYCAPGSEEFTTLMESIADPAVLSLVEGLFGGPCLFRSTSLFSNPLGTSTEGAWHRDSQFLIPDEADERQFIEEQVASKLTHSHGVQMQIALVPNDDVELVKGSHLRWDNEEEYAVRCADGRAHATEPMPNSTRSESRLMARARALAPPLLCRPAASRPEDRHASALLILSAPR
jgi:hypothetical protein